MTVKVQCSKDTLDKWIAALRSEKYHQGRHEMCNANGDHLRYCVLGILEVAISGCVETENEEEYPSTCWLQYHGIKFTSDSDTPFSPRGQELAELNDSGTTFPKMAEWILNHWENSETTVRNMDTPNG